MAAADLTLLSCATRRFHDADPKLATAFVTPIDQAAQSIAGADRLRMTARRVGDLDACGRSSLTNRWRARRNFRAPLYSFFQD